jgi:GT2 family glycosyltransferase
MKSVWIILLNWNGWQDTVKCVASVEKLRHPNFRVVVVDNASTDDSVAQIRRAFPSLLIIESQTNLGFAGGCNLGMKHALGEGADYVWLLNNDTTVDPEALSALVARAESSPSVGAVGSVLFFMDRPDRVQIWGGGQVSFFSGRPVVFTIRVGEPKLQFLCAASMLIPRAALLSVGLLDEGFFMYWEDTDYCFRLRKAGFALAVAPESRVLHKGSASFSAGGVALDTYFTQSSARFFDKHAAFPLVPFWTGVALRLLKRASLRRWRNLRAVCTGAMSGGPQGELRND